MASSSDESYDLPKNFYSMLKNLLRTLFDKKFTFEKPDNWKLPASNNFFSEDYKIGSLQMLKTKLNTVKSKLNDVQIEDWSAHTRRRNPSGEVAWRLKTAIDAEFVTQAWCKFFECLNQFPIVLGPKLNSVHLCEAPGAFIAALNHYLHSNYRSVEWKWLATTLNPYYEGNPLANMVVDDRFMLHTLENWIFGEDFSGNIMNAKNIEDMARKAAELGDINLITADGSIDCMETPECQEEVVSALHYAETCAALRMLSPGGSFILKMFTLFEATSASLLYLLNCVFDKVSVFKPATSKCGNSEVYVVCVGFRKDDGNFSKVHTALMAHLDSQQHCPIFPYEFLPFEFIEQLETCARFFMQQQSMAINRNIVTYRNGGRMDGKRCKIIRTHVTNHYFNRYNVRKIRDEDKILHKRNASVQYFKNSRIYTGSFTERQSLHCKSANERLAVLRSDLENFEVRLNWPYETPSISLNSTESKFSVHLYRGKSFTELFSSLFIDIHLMHLINKVLKVAPDSVGFSIVIELDSKEFALKTFEISLRKNFGVGERLLFKEIVDAVAKYRPDSVILRGLPLLTHFAVSLFSLTFNVFEQVLMDEKGTIKMERLRPEGDKWLGRIDEVFGNEKKLESILCLADIKMLHQTELNDVVTNYNNHICMQYCRKLIDSAN